MRMVRSPIAATARLTPLMLAASLAAGTATAGPKPAPSGLADGMNKLGSEALGHLAARGGDKSVVLSPFGLGSALHLLSLGAAGPAAESLRAKLLPPGLDAGKQAASLLALNRQILQARDKLRLTMASAVFVPRSAEPSPSFAATALEVFDAPIEVLDFRSLSAPERINAWAKEASLGLIPSVVERLDPDARFVLVNAVYFSGAWESAFDPARTARGPFTRIDGSARDAAMMAAEMPVEFAAFGEIEAVWLPYDGKDVTMFMVAPAEGRGPAAVSETLERHSLAELMAQARERRRRATAQVRLPRFRAESDFDVTDALSRQGLGPALSTSRDYRAISEIGGGALMITHRAVLEVTEAGTKAAATTTITTERSLARPSITFSADRPFAFAIVHEPTQAILFAGYIADPGDGPRPTEPTVVR